MSLYIKAYALFHVSYVNTSSYIAHLSHLLTISQLNPLLSLD